ncbi:hypothetical protein Tco_0186218 [Tanacetum coccineum]
MSIQDMKDLKQRYLYEMKKKALATEQVASPSPFFNSFCYDDDDDDDEEYTIAITPDLPAEKPDNSLSMGDKHLDTIPKTESGEFIKSSVEDLVPIPSESEGISDSMCDVPFCDNSTPFEASKDHSEIFIDSNDDYSSNDDDPLYNEDIDYVDASPPDSELVSVEEGGLSFAIFQFFFCYDDDDDDDEEYTITITPDLPTEKPDNSLSMGDKHLDTILETELDEFIKSSVEDLVPMPSESEGIPDNMCDVLFCDNSTPLEALKDHSEIFIDSNDDYSLNDDDPLYNEDIDYVDASPPDSELVSLEEVKDLDPENGGIDDDILLIKDDILLEKLLNIHLLIAKIEALKDNPTPSFDDVTKSPSTSPNFFLEETNTFDNSLPESEIFFFDMEEKSSGNPTSHL